MASGVVKIYADMKGFKVINDVALNLENGFPITYAPGNSASAVSIKIPVGNNVLSKETLKIMKPELKKLGALSIFNGVLSLEVPFPPFGKNKLYDKLDQATTTLVSQLKEHGISASDSCTFCGEGGCSEYAEVNNVVFHCHTYCKEKEAEKLVEKVLKNQKGGFFPLALILSILGGVVGTLPSFITIFWDDTIYAVLFALIPICAYGGYRLGRGALNRAVPFLIAIIALADTLLLCLTIEYILSLQGGYRWDFLTFIFALTEDLAWTFENVIFYWLQSFAFALLGILLSWGIISQGNKQLLKKAEAYKQRVGDEAQSYMPAREKASSFENIKDADHVLEDREYTYADRKTGGEASSFEIGEKKKEKNSFEL